MKFLLETKTCIGYLNGRAPNIALHLQGVLVQDVTLCSVVKAELHYGALRSSRPAQELVKLQQFFAPFVSLAFDDRCVAVYGQVRAHLAAQGLMIGPNDLLIAATALANGLQLVTHNSKEFSRVPGLTVVDWEIAPP